MFMEIMKQQQKDLRTNPPLFQMTEHSWVRETLKIQDHSNTQLGIKPLSTNQTAFFPIWAHVRAFNSLLNHSNF